MILGALHATTDSRIVALSDYITRAAALTRGGATIHIRDHALSGRAFASLADELAKHTSAYFINDRVDVAMSLGAPGVVLGERSLPVAAARGLLGRSCVIGRSVHDLAGANRARDDGADFVVAGSIFATPSHPDGALLGLEGLADIVDRGGLPVIAIGGITLDNAAAVRDRGASGIAAIRALWDVPDPELAARRFCEIFACRQ